MTLRRCWILLSVSLLAVACGDDSGDARSDSGPADGGNECVAPELPTDGQLSLTAAGAPVTLFGSPDAPTFREGYEALRAAGFTRHFPFFGTREIVDRPDGDTTPSTSSGHERYFFDATCEEGLAFVAAQETGMELLFPAFFFYPDGETEAFDADEFRASFERYRTTCFQDAEDVITGYYNYDEMSSNWAGIELVNRAFDMDNPLPPIENASALADTMRELSTVPVYAVDGPARPLLERDRLAITGAGVDLDMLLDDYDTQLRSFAESSDVFGFDAYPIPESYWFPLFTPGDLTRVAGEVAEPDARIVTVLQGMSFDAQGGHTGIGATGSPPSLEETRFMAFDAIVAGAEELIWYGPNFLDLERSEDAAFWNDLQTVVGEIRDLGSALNGTRRELEISEPNVAAAGFTFSGSELVVVVNRSEAEVRAQLPIASATLFRHPTGEVVPSPDVDLGPFEVAIFVTRNCE